MKNTKFSILLVAILVCSAFLVLANTKPASATDATITFTSTVNGGNYDGMRFYVDYGSGQYTTTSNVLQAGTHHIYCEAVYGYVDCYQIHQYRGGNYYTSYAGNTANIDLQDGDTLLFECYTYDYWYW